MNLLELNKVCFSYTRGNKVLNEVSFSVASGRTVGLVGESGSGKSTILKLLMGLAKPSSGAIQFEGAPLDIGNRILMKGYRRAVQPVFQDPYSSLDPRQKVRSIISEPLNSLGIADQNASRVKRALAAVDLPEDAIDRYPSAFSGGQRQRIAIARAIVSEPRLILADEVVSALDLSTQVRIVELFREIASQTTLLFVSHDLAVVAALCDEIVILERGTVVEAGSTRSVLANPQHTYTRSLLDSIPRIPEWDQTHDNVRSDL
ncbi:ABC transporter ATP-binding protein [Sulfitobacter sp. F26204]|uniref:ABC transporter ATP-binding protein n=1 Tax=Sulfitobacter sp. F26204 TaxID=2996014 RepID=UPI00225E19F0|nr:ABC transporter ATP-binding protein [Sulfitobacter sp. F26204]MCX7560498.1 ABC transporter ATP-binding protein [Sulfitobacter sp. F26204]